MSGTIRGYTPGVMDTIRRRMDQIFDGITRAHGGSFRLAIDTALPPVMNDSALARRMLPSLERAAGAGNVRIIEPASVAEDFSYFANAVPGFFFRLGTRAAGGTTGGHHTPTFQADDLAIPVGVRTMTTLLLDFLAGPAR
jgi:metal-dependent amidase/aminoacylase/carboxypeptidase family protein